jgi:hypothetical protein
LIRISRPLLIGVLIALAAASPATGAGQTPAPPSVEGVTSTGYRARVSIGEPSVVHGAVFGFELDEIGVPGGTVEAREVGPPLPVRTVLLSIPWGVKPSISVVPGATRSLGTLHPTPFPHLVTDPDARALRTGPELAAALSAPGYSGAPGGGGRGEGLARWSESSAGGDRLIAVTLRPVTWDPATGEVRFVEEFTVDVRWDRPVEPPTGRGPRRSAAELAPSATIGPAYAPRAASVPAAGAVSVPMRVGPTGPWVRLGAVRPGLYRVTAGDLAAAGATVAAYSVGQQIATAATSFALGLGAVFFIFKFRSFKEVIRAGRADEEREKARQAGASSPDPAAPRARG